MQYDSILWQQRQAVLNLTVNRPDKLNALNMDTLLELGDAFAKASEDQSIRAVVLTGSGEKAFVAGADITELAHLSPIEAREFSEIGQQLMLQIENLGKPVIAALNGFALGGGCELALACTARIASENARIGLPEVKLGLMPGFGGTQRLVRMLGRSRSLALCLSGEPITAQQAEMLGLVAKVFSQKELLEQAGCLANKLATSAPIAMQHIIEAIQHGADLPLQDALTMESQLFALCCSTDDMREGTQAFMEKRKPTFKGS